MLRVQASEGFAPYGKTGAGNYGSTLGKQNITYTNPVRDRVIEMIKSIPFPDKKSVYSIGDYGTADGAASMAFIQDVIITLKEQHGPQTQFQVIYEDKEVNDFNSLFKRLSGIINDPPSYMLELDNVYPLASGINFRKQCVPCSTMQFIMSSAAVQWLSKPIEYKESIFVYPNGSQEERRLLDKQTTADWESFLYLRSIELKRGGILLVITSAEVGRDRENTRFTLKNFIYLMTKISKSFRDSGKITSEEFINTNYCSCMFTLGQLQSPFKDKTSSVYQSGLRLLSAELVTVEDVFYSAWREKKEMTGLDDRKEFAKKYVTAHRCWSHSTILSGLSERRPQQERDDIVNDFYISMENEIAKMNPETFKDDLLLSYVVMKKE